MQKKIDSLKAILNTEIKEIQWWIRFLLKNSESLDAEFVKLLNKAENSKDAHSLISRENALKRKCEVQQGEHKKLEKSLNNLK